MISCTVIQREMAILSNPKSSRWEPSQGHKVLSLVSECAQRHGLTRWAYMESLNAHMRARYPNLDYPESICYIGEIKPLTTAQLAQMPFHETSKAVQLERRSKMLLNVNLSENEMVVYQSADSLYTHPNVVALYHDLLIRLREALGREWVTLKIQVIDRVVVDPT